MRAACDRLAQFPSPSRHRTTDYRRMPWQNGGGETREIAVSPVGATLDTLRWRISLTTVASGGPFSTFSGVTRTLSAIQGAGLQLKMGDEPPRVLPTTSEPCTFEMTTDADSTIVFCRADSLVCGGHELNAQDCAIIDGPAQAVQLSAAQPADLYLIELYR
jgi:environmental stress-induced protein Ves